MSTNPLSRLALPELQVTADIMKLKASQRARLMRGVAKLRKHAAAEIERLLDFLDRTEIDADFEPVGDEEPWLGSRNPFEQRSQEAWGYSATDDTEDGDDNGIGDSGGLNEQTNGDDDQSDREPSLGSLAMHENDSQDGWAVGCMDDLEVEVRAPAPEHARTTAQNVTVEIVGWSRRMIVVGPDGARYRGD